MYFNNGVPHVPSVLLCWWTVALGIQCNATQLHCISIFLHLYLQFLALYLQFLAFVFVFCICPSLFSLLLELGMKPALECTAKHCLMLFAFSCISICIFLYFYLHFLVFLFVFVLYFYLHLSGPENAGSRVYCNAIPAHPML